MNYVLTTLLAFWPHVPVVVVVAFLSTRVRGARSITSAVVAISIATTVFYWVMQNGVAPSYFQPGQLIALALAGMIPLIAATAIGRALVDTKAPPPLQVFTAALSATLLIPAVPFAQYWVGCLLTGICL